MLALLIYIVYSVGFFSPVQKPSVKRLPSVAVSENTVVTQATSEISLSYSKEKGRHLVVRFKVHGEERSIYHFSLSLLSA